MGFSLILGVDGKVHTGQGERKMSGWWAETDCDTIPLRPITEREVQVLAPGRVCTNCMEETDA